MEKGLFFEGARTLPERGGKAPCPSEERFEELMRRSFSEMRARRSGLDNLPEPQAA